MSYTHHIIYSFLVYLISKYPFLAVNRRLKFGDGRGAAPFQSAIIYLGDRLGKFRRIFGKYGTLYMPVIEVA